jgi:hypothetical protein
MTAGDSLNETNLKIKALQSPEVMYDLSTVGLFQLCDSLTRIFLQVIRASEVSHIVFTDIQKSLEKTPFHRM